MTRITIACFVAAALCAAAACPALAQQPGPIACPDSPIVLPFTFPYQCNRLQTVTGYTSAAGCVFDRFDAVGTDRNRQFVVAIIKRHSNGDQCPLLERQDVPADLRGTTPFVRDKGSNFGPMQTQGGGYAMTFTGTGNSGPVNCFSFLKYGAKRVVGYEAVLRGYVCNRDGAAVSDGEMQEFIQAVGAR